MAFTRRQQIMPSGPTTIEGMVTTTPATPGQANMAASAPVVIASNQTAVPVSAAALPLPAGAATAANQVSILGFVDGIETLLAGPLNTALPAGAAIAAKQPAFGTSGTPATDVLTVQGAPAWGCPIPVLLPKSSKADLSMTEQMDQLFAAQCAMVHLLGQIVALMRGRPDPMPGDEADVLIGEYLDSRTRLTNIVN